MGKEFVNEEIGLKYSALNGVKKDIPDERDFIFKAPKITLPVRHDLRAYAGEIENQLSTGSCVANATCSTLELFGKRQGLDLDLSRLFVYYEARAPYPELKEVDEGAYLRDGLKVCNQIGVPDEKYWDFIEEKVNEKPTPIAYEKAPENINVKYERIFAQDLISLKSTIASGLSVVFGIILYEEFFYLKGDLSTQNYLGSRGGSQSAGGHAMSIVGYDDTLNGGSFIVENSWSEQWGDKGYCAIAYDVFRNDAMDAWVCTEFLRVEPKPEPSDIDIEEPMNFVEELYKFIEKSIRKIFEFFYTFPTMNEIWSMLLSSLKDLIDAIKNIFK